MQVEYSSVAVSTHYKGRPRPQPVWIGRWISDGRDTEKVLGRAHRGRGRPPEGFMTQADAERALEEHLRVLGAAMQAREGITFGEVAAAYVEEMKLKLGEESLKAATFRTYMNILNRVFLTRWEDVAVELLTADEISDLYSDLRRAKRKPTTMNQHRAVLRGVLKLARSKAFKCEITDEVFEAWEWVTTKRHKSKAITFYTPEEAQRLAEYASTLQDATLFLTAAFTGLRIGELLALRWRDIDFDSEVIRVVQAFTEPFLVDDVLYGGEAAPKSWGGRVMPLMPLVGQRLGQLRQRERWTSRDDLVFPNEIGENWDHSKVYKRFKKASRAAGLHSIRLHDLRHSFGTMAIKVATIIQVQEWMGHADIETTRKYLHYAPQPDMAQALQSLVSQPVAPVAAVKALRPAS